LRVRDLGERTVQVEGADKADRDVDAAELARGLSGPVVVLREGGVTLDYRHLAAKLAQLRALGRGELQHRAAHPGVQERGQGGPPDTRSGPGQHGHPALEGAR
jgi:hypothetical protein